MSAVCVSKAARGVHELRCAAVLCCFCARVLPGDDGFSLNDASTWPSRAHEKPTFVPRRTHVGGRLLRGGECCTPCTKARSIYMV